MIEKKINSIVILGLNNIGLKIYKYLIKKKQKIKVFKRKVTYNEIYKYRPDVILSLGYRHIISKEILNIPRYGSYNIHKSLLPLNKGANPVFWTIFNESPAGISIHKIDNKIDSGPLVMQKKINYDFSFDAKKLYNKLEREQEKLFFKFWENLKNSNIKTVRNKNLKASIHKKKDFINLVKLKKIDKKSFFSFINLVRASTFPPFKNLIIRKKNKSFHVELKITKLKKIKKKIKYGLLQSY